MAFYGSLEFSHDLLHYLAAHHHSAVHSHLHDDDHTIHDHEHFGSGVNHPSEYSHEDGLPESLPSLINFFLYIQYKQVFTFSITFLRVVHIGNLLKLPILEFPPLVPPPQSHLTS
jgi:hypothetical protein